MSELSMEEVPAESEEVSAFTRARRMAAVSRVLASCGVSKTTLAEKADFSRTALSNKFGWAEATISFQLPPSRDSFSEADAKRVLDALEEITKQLQAIVFGARI